MKITDHARRVLREKIELHTGVRVSGLAMDDIAMSLEGAAQYSAALSPPPVDAAAGVEVRVAVAFDDSGHAWAETIYPENIYPDAEDDAWRALKNAGHVHRAAIITARVPLPSVPVVSGVVGEAGE